MGGTDSLVMRYAELECGSREFDCVCGAWALAMKLSGAQSTSNAFRIVLPRRNQEPRTAAAEHV